MSARQAPGSAAGGPPDDVMTALRDLYDDEGVAIWLKGYRDADAETRERLTQSIMALVDGGYL